MRRIVNIGKPKLDFFLLLAFLNVFFLAVYSLGQGQDQSAAVIPKLKLQPASIYKAENLRDPFKNPFAASALPTGAQVVPDLPDIPPPALKVQGIFWGGSFPQAIINDKVVKVGDEIEKAKVISIDKDSVKVFFVSRNIVLSSPASVNLSNSTLQKSSKEATDE